MKTMNTADARGARSLACAYLLRHRRAAQSVVAASLVACFAIAWGESSGATPFSLVSPASVDVLSLQSGCDDDAFQCNDLGVSYLRGYGVPVDLSLALRAFERSCEQGSPDGCANLGALYESGAAVPASLTEAARLYEQACTLGCALGCSNLGALYARGRGVNRDLSEARRLFTLACETGSAAGCNNQLQFPAPQL
jgi:TPR repeat protein